VVTAAATRRIPHPRQNRSPAEAPPVVDAALALLVVASALTRYLTEVAVRSGSRGFSRRLPTAGPASALLRLLGGPVPQALTHPLSAVAARASAAADRLVPQVVRAVLARIDVPSLVREYVALDDLAAMLDVDAVVARADLDAAVRRVDIDAVLDRVDLDAVAARLDLEAVVARLDLDHVFERVDIARVVDRADVDAIVAKVDLDRAVERVDVDRVIARADITGLAWYVVREIDLAGLLRASSGSVTSEMVRSVRDQSMDADRAVERVVDRLLRRSGRRTALADREPGAGS
jgi:hypothetical protein